MTTPFLLVKLDIKITLKMKLMLDMFLKLPKELFETMKPQFGDFRKSSCEHTVHSSKNSVCINKYSTIFAQSPWTFVKISTSLVDYLF